MPITVSLRQVSATSSEASIRTHRVTVDRPAEKGGTDSGPMGGELFLASIGGCFLSNLLAAIRAREAKVSNAAVEVIGTAADAPPRFISVEMLVSADHSDPAEFEKLVQIAERGCIMVNTMRQGLEFKVRIGAAA